MTSLNLRIDKDLAAELDRLAKARHQTKSELAREFIRRRLAVERMRELRRRTLPRAEAAGYLVDEDILSDPS